MRNVKSTWWPGLFLFVVFAAFARTTPVRADTLQLPASLAQAVVSESAPEAFTPNEITTNDYAIEWAGAPLAGVQARLEPNSLQWVRVGEVFVLPRARVLIETTGPATSGLAVHAGYAQPFLVQNGKATAAVPVLLASGDASAIDVTIDNSRKGRLRLRFRPDPGSNPKWGITYDSSCSPFRVQASNVSGKQKDQWTYLGCRVAHYEAEHHSTTSFELYVFWDNVGQSIKVNGVDTPSLAGNLSTWRLRLPPGKREVTLEAPSGEKLTIGYASAIKDHAAFLGLGVGPYRYTFEAERMNTHSVVALPTLYGGYYLNDTTSLVFFDATAIHRNFFTDFGFYLRSQSIKALDNRLMVNLMLGAHTLIFRTNDNVYLKPTGPQGIELIYRDFLKRSCNLALGAFVYPPISGKAYNNVWLRWGSSALFGELNYLSWQEGIGENSDQRVYARAVGISIGFPLVRFF